ncbi:hypothetical protein OE88DRAFT_1658425 [Heliocybe sulcata]|uniref:GPI anchored protein n=1 Tax=Heliocybe sulcata TaxID=5364 RepID=A0A5C3N6U4_9AGAM|nr:hypothetical protein OE88DRAFT_1658425 [Heliocybe sulcata]
MVGKVSSAALASILVLSLSVHAQTSLFIPGFDDQPISASLIGAGSDGRTTWAIASGAVTGSVDDSFPGTATIAEGPNDVILTYSIDGVGSALESCGFSNGLALCTEVANFQDGLYTATETDTISSMLVQFAAPTGTDSSSPSRTGGSSAPSATSKGSQTGSGSGSAAPTSSNTSGGMSLKHLASGVTGAVVAGAVLCLL